MKLLSLAVWWIALALWGWGWRGKWQGCWKADKRDHKIMGWEGNHSPSLCYVQNTISVYACE